MERLDERVAHFERREAAEVAIGTQEDGHPMRNAERRDTGVVHAWTRNSPTDQQRLQARPMRITILAEQAKRRLLQPRIDLITGGREWRRRAKDARVRHDREKLMHTGPGNGPRRRAGRQFLERCPGGSMEDCILPMRGHQDIGIDRNHRAPSS